MSKKKEAVNILKENPEIDYKDLSERVGYSSESSAWKVKQEFQEENPHLYSDQNSSENGDLNDETDETSERNDERTDETERKERKETDERKGKQVKNGGDNETDSISKPNFSETDEKQGKRSSDNQENPTPSNTKQEGSGINIGSGDGSKSVTGADRSVIENESEHEVNFESRAEQLAKESDDLDPSDISEENEEFVDQMEENNEGGDLMLSPEMFEGVFKTSGAIIGQVRDKPDLWEITDQEAETNAKLLVEYCDQKDINIGPGDMLVLNMAGQYGFRLYQDLQMENEKEEDSEKRGNERKRSSDNQENPTPNKKETEESGKKSEAESQGESVDTSSENKTQEEPEILNEF